jgi:anti-anti-sigma factor
MENRAGDLGFEYRERTDPDGARRLTLLGEVDIAVAGELARRLRRLECAGARTRLDLSELRFIDLCGLDAILDALRRARGIGWELEVDPHVSRSVERIVSYAGVQSLFWPRGSDHAPARFQPFMSRWAISSPQSEP